MVISDQRNVGGTDLISTFTVATERLLPSRHMGSLITSDFSCKSTLRVEEWKMKFEDNNYGHPGLTGSFPKWKWPLPPHLNLEHVGNVGPLDHVLMKYLKFNCQAAWWTLVYILYPAFLKRYTAAASWHLVFPRFPSSVPFLAVFKTQQRFNCDAWLHLHCTSKS